MHKSGYGREYVESKKNIYKYQDENSLLVLNEDNDITTAQ